MYSKKHAVILTLGCKVNQYESEAFAAALRKKNFEVSFFDTDNGNESENPHDVCIINTCSVTGEADRKSRQMVRRLIAANPGSAVYVTGCAAQASPKKFAEIPGVTAVVGNARKNEILKLINESFFPENDTKSYRFVSDEKSVPICGCKLDGTPFEPMSISGFRRARAYIKIEDGCESKCAYCIIPSVRGKIRSKPRSDVLSEAIKLTGGGCPELVLTGIETSAYQYGLAELIEELETVPALRRIRLGSLDPSFMRHEFVDTYAKCSKAMPHFHLSMQSGCDRTLASMRRKYNVKSIHDKLAYIRSVIPDVRFSADVICGFPGETDDDFAQTLNFFKEERFLHLHVFPYSVRPGTEAASMPDHVPHQTAKMRCAELSSAQKVITAELLSETISSETPVEVLAETASYSGSSLVITGHTPNFTETRIYVDNAILRDLGPDLDSDTALIRGKILKAIPTDADGECLIASITAKQ